MCSCFFISPRAVHQGTGFSLFFSLVKDLPLRTARHLKGVENKKNRKNHFFDILSLGEQARLFSGKEGVSLLLNARQDSTCSCCVPSAAAHPFGPARLDLHKSDSLPHRYTGEVGTPNITTQGGQGCQKSLFSQCRPIFTEEFQTFCPLSLWIFSRMCRDPRVLFV